MPILRESIEGVEVTWGDDRRETRVVPLLTPEEYQTAREYMERALEAEDATIPYVVAAAVIRSALVRRYDDALSVLDVVENLDARDIAPLWNKLIDLSLLANASYPKLPQ
jgi:predicted nucleic acid-binding protein